MAAERQAATGLLTGQRAWRTRPQLRPGLLLSSLVCLVSLGCGSPAPRAPNPARPLDERRAIEIILLAFQDERDAAVRGRPVMLAQGVALEVDVAAQGRKYGVAYVTGAEQLRLGVALPAREQSRGDALQLVTGLGEDGDARVLVLHDTDYLYDDQLGDANRQTTVTAELKLRRDVRDFLVLAKSKKWP